MGGGNIAQQMAQVSRGGFRVVIACHDPYCPVADVEAPGFEPVVAHESIGAGTLLPQERLLPSLSPSRRRLAFQLYQLPAAMTTAAVATST